MFVVLLTLVVGSLGCGMTTHNVIAHRAMEYFFAPKDPKYGELSQRYPQALLGGAPFPDYLYECGTDHDAGEAAHWPPFLAAAAKFIRRQPTPWSESTGRLVAFMMGVASHQIADVTWHGLSSTPSGYGFIETLGIADFNCTGNLCSVAHTAADTGGEFVAAFQTDLQWLEPLEWYIPTKELVEIFADPLVNKTVTPDSIETCHAIFVIGTLAVKYVSNVVFTEETTKSPFLVESYIDHPLGGVDDMAVWTGRMWNRFGEWVDQGPPSHLPPDLTSGRRFIPKYSRLMELGRRVQQEMRKAGDVNVTTNVAVREAVRRLYPENNPPTRVDPVVHGNTDEVVHETGSYRGDNPLAYVGAALAVGDWDGDGTPDCAFGAWGHTDMSRNEPQNGAVYIDYGCATNGTDAPLPFTLLKGSHVFGRFGRQLTSLDLNRDGIDDLVVASPTSGHNWTHISKVPTFKYRGSVQVFFGSLNKLPITPGFEIVADVDLVQLGLMLTAQDLNGDGHLDLLVGAHLSRGGDITKGDERGQLHGFLASPHWKGIVTPTAADVTIYGTSDFGWFGFSSVVVDSEILLVGSPAYRTGRNGPTVGRVFAFTVGTTAALKRLQNATAESAAVYTITGHVQKAKFGYSLATGTPLVGTSDAVVAAGMPSHGVDMLSGVVVVFHLSKDWTGDIPLSHVPTVTRLECGTYGARFGWGVAFGDVIGDKQVDLLVSMPLYNTVVDSKGHQHGGLVVYQGGKAFPKGVVSKAEDKGTWRVLGKDPLGRLGESFASFPVSSGPDTLIVGEPRTSQKKEMTGSVHFYAH